MSIHITPCATVASTVTGLSRARIARRNTSRVSIYRHLQKHDSVQTYYIIPDLSVDRSCRVFFFMLSGVCVLIVTYLLCITRIESASLW